MRLKRKVQEVRVVEEKKKDAPPKPETRWLHQDIEKDKPRWTYLVPIVASSTQAFAAFLAGLCILIPTWRNYVETQDKNRVERKENTIRRLETQFSEVQNRLSNSDPQTRAVAIMQLADLAQTPMPTEALTPEEVNAKVKITDFSREHYPFFLRAVRQYATILPMEKDGSVRGATKDAVFLLVAFLKNYMPQTLSESTRPPPKALLAPEYIGVHYWIKGEDGKTKMVEYQITDVHVALAEMTNEFADANRKAKDNFIRAFAHYSVKNPIPKARKDKPDKSYDVLVATTNFCETDEKGKKATMDALKALQETPTFAMQWKIYNEQRNAQNPVTERPKKDVALLDALELEARKLAQTRDTLATILTGHANDWHYNWRKMLAQPAGFAEQDKSKGITARTLVGWFREPNVNLDNCFLAGARLAGAQLQGVDLTRAQLQGADLRVAQLQWANLYGAQLQGADLMFAQLQKAILWNAQLQGADLDRAQLQGANLGEAQCDNRTRLYAISVQEEDASTQGGYERTNFEAVNWWDADFKPRDSFAQSADVNEQTKKVKAWLQKNFPKPQTPKP